MAGTNVYRVNYGFFDKATGGKLISEEKYQDMVAVNAQEATLKTVFTNNGITRNGQFLQIMGVRNIGPSGGDNGANVIS